MHGRIGFRHVVSHKKSSRWRSNVRMRRDDLQVIPTPSWSIVNLALLWEMWVIW
jgi:hypothetical protein